MSEEQPFTPPCPLNTAVLFLIYKRPDTTKQVFEAIRQAKPPRLYVAADGPKAGVPGESEKVRQTRDIVLNGVDWDCQVKTLFRDKNFGCKYGPISGINWFFENEIEGIILEDDCLPSESFFHFCELMLDKYRDEHRVWHINGNNFDADEILFGGYSYSFSALSQVWGWATWRTRWMNYLGNPFYLHEKSSRMYPSWSLSAAGKYNKFKHIDKLKKGLDAWDYQWQITVLNANGLCVCPSINLISNIGDGDQATHTKKDNRVRLEVKNFQNPITHALPELNKRLTFAYEKKMGLTSAITIFRNILEDIRISIPLRSHGV